MLLKIIENFQKWPLKSSYIHFLTREDIDEENQNIISITYRVFVYTDRKNTHTHNCKINTFFIQSESNQNRPDQPPAIPNPALPG